MKQATPRRRFEQPDAPDVSADDYVQFYGVVATEEHRIMGSSKKIPVVREEAGSGLVLRVSSSRKQAWCPVRSSAGFLGGELDPKERLAFKVARVDAGQKLGVVTAILNGAEVVGRQAGLFDG